MIEDYTDSYKFMLFGKEYEDYRKYMYEGYSLLIRGSFQLNTWRKDAEVFDFKIKSITVLNNAREDIIHNLLIRLSVNDINEEFIREIHEKTSQNTGKARIKFCLVDENEGISVELFSRNTSVSASNELIKYLDERPEIEYKVS
jgi:DNA polymerase-3 subunit alpha